MFKVAANKIAAVATSTRVLKTYILARILYRLAPGMQGIFEFRLFCLSNLRLISTFHLRACFSGVELGHVDVSPGYKWAAEGTFFMMRRSKIDARVADVLSALATGLLALCVAIPGQAQTQIAWKRVAGTTLNEALAGPASGPVSAITIYRRSQRPLGANRSGTHLRNQRLHPLASEFQHRFRTAKRQPGCFHRSSIPEPGVRIPGRFRTPLRDRSFQPLRFGRQWPPWLNLTGFNNRSIIGSSGFTGFAMSPSNPQELSAANQFPEFGAPLDGGLSLRQSLNEELPLNLAVRKLSRPPERRLRCSPMAR